jgi:hypothetical protein
VLFLSIVPLIPARIPDDKRTEILQWLSPVIPSASYNEACAKRIVETGNWFLTSEHFSQWKSQADLLLWIYGKRTFTRMIAWLSN